MHCTISNRISPFVSPNYTANEIHENIEFLIKSSGIDKDGGTNREIKENYKSIFASKAEDFKKETLKTLVKDCSPELLRGYLLEYSFYKITSAYFQSKITDPDKRQHWISKFYLKYFAYEGDLSKNIPTEPNLGKTNLHDDFKMENPKDRIYTDLGEEMLSKVEGDLSNLNFDEFAENGVKTVYDHVVLAAFFSLLFIRTKSKIDAGFTLSQDIVKNFLPVLDLFATGKTIKLMGKLQVTINSSDEREEDDGFIFGQVHEVTPRLTQDPVIPFGSIDGTASFLAPLTKDYIIIFLHEGEEININAVLAVFGLDKERSKEISYHHPRENAISISHLKFKRPLPPE